MSTAARRDGRDHDTLIPGTGAAAALVVLAALAAQFAPQKVAAQSAPCTAIADDAERLACYDRALRATPAAPAPTAVPTPTPTAEPTPPAPAPASEAPIAPAVQTPVAPVEVPTTSVAQASAAEDQQQDADRQIVPIVVVGVRTLQGRATTFTTQDGAAWVQTDSQRLVGLPAPPFEAELKPGLVGSTFLVPKNGARAIRVRPVDR
ncbi:MAG TPA: hypothetical protein VN818_06935 [Gammaproteobacteria bacterium]|nr:hypothetical protein [Gammaproteobacteria bacterium]